MYKITNSFYTRLLISVSFILISFSVFAIEINLSRSKLVQLAQHIEADDLEKHYYFSQIALLEMYDTYQYELERSLTQTATTMEKMAKLRHWRFSVHSYLETLNEYLYLMDSGVPINYFVSPQDKIFLLIGEVPVIISGPNVGADKQIERNIVEQFCLKYDCLNYFSQQETANEKELLNQSYSSEWSIESSNQVAYIMDNGLTFNFSAMNNRPEKELWANQLSDELNLVLKNLHRTKEKGKKIDWSLLMIESLPLTDNAYKIIINQQQDYVKITLEILGKNPQLFNSFIPWLKKHFEHQSSYRMIINNTEQYLNF